MAKLFGLLLVAIGLMLVVYTVSPAYTLSRDFEAEKKAVSIIKAQLEKENTLLVPKGVEPVVFPVPDTKRVYQAIYRWNETWRTPIMADTLEEFGQVKGWEDVVEPHQLTIYVDVDGGKIIYADRSVPMTAMALEKKLNAPYRTHGIALAMLGGIILLTS